MTQYDATIIARDILGRDDAECVIYRNNPTAAYGEYAVEVRTARGPSIIARNRYGWEPLLRGLRERKAVVA